MTDKIYRSEVLEPQYPNSNQNTSSNAATTSKDFIRSPAVEANYPQKVVASQLISISLDTQSKRILAPFTFGQLGAVKIGKYAAGVSGELALSPNGLVARNSSNQVTFSIDGVTGDATFKGTVAAGSVITGYLLVGGAASDVNGGSTTISGGKITSNSITSTQLSTGELITLSAQIKDGTITNAKINDLNADKINAGTISVGGTNQPTAILIKRDNSGQSNGSTYLRWDGGGSRIWVDSSDRMGINSIGTPMYIYVNSAEKIIIPESGQITMRGGAYLGTAGDATSGNLNVNGIIKCNKLDLSQNYSENDIDNVNQISGYNDLYFLGNGDYNFLKSGGGNGARIEWSTGKIHSFSSTIDLGGSDKSAIVPVDDEFRALYCMESPEVWFMDFVDTVHDIDPMFETVTEGQKYFVPCYGEDMRQHFQVWRRRKGHANKRFELKTKQEFEANERFLQAAKP